MSDNSTLLTGEMSEQEQEEVEKRRLEWERLDILLNICYDHYTDKNTKPDISKFCKVLVSIVQRYEWETYDKFPELGCHRRIGKMVMDAMSFDDKREGGNIPFSMKSAFKVSVLKLVEMAHKDGLSRNKESQTKSDTAFKFISKLLYKYGVTFKGKPYKTSTISNWCDDASLESKKEG